MDDAEKMSEQAIKTRRKLFGQDHPDTLASIATLASMYKNQCRWDKAEELGVQVLETN
jgi:hypothetical protein